jgi:hypothetical protein
MTDDLRNRIRRLDPMHPGVPTVSATTPSSRQRLEDIMATDISEPTTREARPAVRWYPVTAAAALVIVAAIGVGALRGGGTDPDVVAGPPLELALGAQDPMAMCLAFDVAILAEMPMAFEGTVTAVDGERITLTVDRWFKGGDAAEVMLTGPAGLEALIDGIAFVVGSQYLITATDGQVNYCGFSGASTPELRAAFEQAFGG